MSSESLPITPAAFAAAIKELPLASIYAKVSEIRNSIAHLRRSNSELQTFIAESCDTEAEKQELATYISENEDVIAAMNERIDLLKAEVVEGRGQQWIELDEAEPGPGPEAEAEAASEPELGSNLLRREREEEAGAEPLVNGTTRTTDRLNDEEEEEEGRGEEGVFL